jgi:pSer/pThr/pTyr-binding forkhead associated (FHA) protein
MGAFDGATPILRLANGPLAGQIFDLRSTLRIGRHPFNEISLNDPALSRYHCWIAFQDGKAVVEDLASVNGTSVNGARVEGRHPVKPGDVIRAGSSEFVVEATVYAPENPAEIAKSA